jgi:hypothetical protein
MNQVRIWSIALDGMKLSLRLRLGNLRLGNLTFVYGRSEDPIFRNSVIPRSLGQEGKKNASEKRGGEHASFV